jgi:hypothetical protein
VLVYHISIGLSFLPFPSCLIPTNTGISPSQHEYQLFYWSIMSCSICGTTRGVISSCSHGKCRSCCRRSHPNDCDFHNKKRSSTVVQDDNNSINDGAAVNINNSIINSGAATNISTVSSSQSSSSSDSLALLAMLSEIKKMNENVASLAAKLHPIANPISQPTSSVSNIQASASSPHIVALPTGEVNASQLLARAKDKNLEVSNNNNIDNTTITPPLSSVSSHPFSSMRHGLALIPAGHDNPTISLLASAFSTLTKANYRPFRTVDDFKEALMSWLSSQSTNLMKTPGLYQAMVEYITETLAFANSVGVDNAFKYHQKCQKAGSHDPPLYNPLSDGPIYTLAHSLHIAPFVNKSSVVYNHGKLKRTKLNKGDNAGSSTAASSTSSASSTTSTNSKTCRLHPGTSHSNEECRKQKSGG